MWISNPDTDYTKYYGKLIIIKYNNKFKRAILKCISKNDDGNESVIVGFPGSNYEEVVVSNLIEYIYIDNTITNISKFNMVKEILISNLNPEIVKYKIFNLLKDDITKI